MYNIWNKHTSRYTFWKIWTQMKEMKWPYAIPLIHNIKLWWNQLNIFLQHVYKIFKQGFRSLKIIKTWIIKIVVIVDKNFHSLFSTIFVFTSEIQFAKNLTINILQMNRPVWNVYIIFSSYYYSIKNSKYHYCIELKLKMFQ